MPRIVAALAYPAIDPVFLHLGPIAIRWYGVAYLVAFFLAYLGLQRMVRSGRLRLSHERLADLLYWLIAGVMVGGRVGWWIFYHRDEGAAEPWYEPLAIWHGGMSFHGGLTGVGVAIFAWAWRNRASPLNIADCVALITPMGLFFGRVANFINAELVGRPTSVPWGIIFPGEIFARHPSQLYEALLEGPLLLAALWAFASRRRRNEGQTASAFLLLYGVMRFVVEFTRQPDEQLGFIAFGWLTMGQLLSLIISLVGAGLGLGIRIKRAANLNSRLASAPPIQD